MALSVFDKQLLNTEQQAGIEFWTKQWEMAKDAGNTDQMAFAHQQAEIIRAKAGYSGGSWGNSVVSLLGLDPYQMGITGGQGWDAIPGGGSSGGSGSSSSWTSSGSSSGSGSMSSILMFAASAGIIMLFLKFMIPKRKRRYA